jgi:hypothetical protein
MIDKANLKVFVIEISPQLIDKHPVDFCDEIIPKDDDDDDDNDESF